MKTSPGIVALAFMATALITRGSDAATNWSEKCTKCHGDDGHGNTKMGKKLGIADLTDAQVQAKFTDADIVKAVKEGIKGKDGKLAMKPIEGLSDEEINALVTVVRGLKK